MPLPISHSLIGAGIAALLLPRTSLRKDWLILIFAAFLANVPDFDFFAVWILGLEVEWHRSFTHSIFFSFVFTSLIFIGTGYSHVRKILACGAALLSHCILDFCTTKEGSGVELLYPFSSERLKLGLFSISEFEQGFYFFEVFKSALVELVILTPIFLVILWFRGYLFDLPFINDNS